MYCLLFVHSYMMLHVFFAVSKVAPIRAGSGASLPLYFATFIPSILGVGSNPGECWQFLWMFKNMEHMGKHMLGAKKLSLVMWLRHHCKHGEISAVHWSNGSDPFVQRLTSPTVWSILLPPLKNFVYLVQPQTPWPLFMMFPHFKAVNPHFHQETTQKSRRRMCPSSTSPSTSTSCPCARSNCWARRPPWSRVATADEWWLSDRWMVV